jgi:hypothetical protein
MLTRRFEKPHLERDFSDARRAIASYHPALDFSGQRRRVRDFPRSLGGRDGCAFPADETGT